jgi:hypothetical protein
MGKIAPFFSPIAYSSWLRRIHVRVLSASCAILCLSSSHCSRGAAQLSSQSCVYFFGDFVCYSCALDGIGDAA